MLLERMIINMNLKLIPHFEGYSIDAVSGLVFSHKTDKFLLMKPNNHGYGRTEVYNKGRRKHIFNHIKVVEVHGDKYGNFIPKDAITLRELYLSIDHLNSNKLDPSKTNLELVLHSENVKRYHARDNEETDYPIPDII